jgi:hypothetical protein
MTVVGKVAAIYVLPERSGRPEKQDPGAAFDPTNCIQYMN